MLCCSLPGRPPPRPPDVLPGRTKLLRPVPPCSRSIIADLATLDMVPCALPHERDTLRRSARGCAHYAPPQGGYMARAVNPGTNRPGVGYIGLGLMGKPMARNVLKAGFPLVVHNRSRAKMDELVAEGATAAASPAEVARQVDIVLTCLPGPADVELVAAHVDMLRVGTRNMMNFPLLRECGRSGRPVMLKRGMSATIEEWLMAAEYVAREGNSDIVLCERGIRTYEPSYRNT
ncbi:MAG: hypothetical protein C4289_02870, partial [Chloroflexota bacterium]